MLDLKELDNLFNDADLNKPENFGNEALVKHKRIMRFIKIGFPAVAAALIGLLAILPSLQERNDFSLQISKPSRQDLEKLHMENTVLYLTDKSNRVSSFVAQNIDETEAGSQLVKINKPVGKMPTSDTAWLDVVAPTGFYNQKTKLLSLNENVEITYSDGMKAHTEIMYYDAEAGKAYGNKPIAAKGIWGTLDAQGFEYYTDKEQIIFVSKTDIHTTKVATGEKTDISAKEKIEFFRQEQKMIATGNAVVVRQGMNIHGDVLTAVFSRDKNGKNALSDFSGKGNISVDNGKNKVNADNLKTFFNKDNTAIDRIEMTGHVKTRTADGEIYADKGIYYPDSGTVKLFENIVIVKNGNRMQGNSAETNLKTGISKLNSGGKGKGRVSGVFYEDSLQKK